MNGRSLRGALDALKLKAIFNINAAMYVCLCQGVTERQVQKCIDEGAHSVSEVTRRCGAGGHCGSCRPTIAAMVAASEAQAGERDRDVVSLPMLPTFA